MDPHSYDNVDIAIIKPHFGVAENGAAWITEDQLGHRVILFITQHLVAIVCATDQVANMNDAYDRIAGLDFGWVAFIAGPSKPPISNSPRF
ncbi:L-lactate dehydrogenase complex protein LldG [Mucilaginibacter oryzae]|uniref:L-lactate dehydrogenase complex protein LldG n=2 Tax=Mucilaginibacter oryzae TaxID=468058 RepID=A0A316H968_9SPHI|nr:L-lactate dehydrogenase complex protein LldG [Mucilaginibacter oryzae]